MSLSATEIGTIKALWKGNSVEIKDVLLVQHLTINLLSVSKIVSSGKEVVFKSNTVIIRDSDGKVMATGRKSGALYKLDLKVVTNTVCASTVDETNLWHQRYGHIGNEYLGKLTKNNMVDGMSSVNVSNKTEIWCEVCVSAKQTRNSFNKLKKERSSRPLELIHSDVCGPMETETWNGMRYFASFTDDFMHVTKIYLMRQKSELFSCFQQYEAMATAHFERPISRIRCDNGGEYKNTKFSEFCAKKGIQIEFTVAYTPEQNGVSERLNRTLVNKTRAMLIGKSVPKKLWGEAVETAAYLLNRNPTIATQENKTPIELWTGKKPNVKNLRIFGSKCFVRIPKQQLQKLDKVSMKNVFVGYAANGYRVWNGKQVITARDVVFNENENNCECTRQRGTFEKPESNHEHYSELLRSCSDERALEKGNEEEQTVERVSTKEAVVEAEETEAQADDEAEFEAAGNPEQECQNEEQGTPILASSTKPVRSNRMKPKRLLDYILGMATLVANEPTTIQEALDSPESQFWKDAMQEEIGAHNEIGTWELVDLPAGKRAIGSKWVYKIKHDETGKVQRYKARIVAQGYAQIPGIEYDEVYAPVSRYATIRTLMTIAGRDGLLLKHLDVKTAYLNSEIDEEIYMYQPKGYEVPGKEKKVCRLIRSIYGLKQSARCWNLKITEILKNLGFTKGTTDECIFIKNMKSNKKNRTISKRYH